MQRLCLTDRQTRVPKVDLTEKRGNVLISVEFSCVGEMIVPSVFCRRTHTRTAETRTGGEGGITLAILSPKKANLYATDAPLKAPDKESTEFRRSAAEPKARHCRFPNPILRQSEILGHVDIERNVRVSLRQKSNLLSVPVQPSFEVTPSRGDIP